MKIEGVSLLALPRVRVPGSAGTAARGTWYRPLLLADRRTGTASVVDARSRRPLGGVDGYRLMFVGRPDLHVRAYSRGFWLSEPLRDGRTGLPAGLPEGPIDAVHLVPPSGWRG